MGHGLRLASGRLVAPFVCGAPEPSPAISSHTHSCSLLSDSHGDSWRLGGIAQNGSAETAMVELQDGTLFASMRDRGPSSRDSFRLSARSRTAGESWGDFSTIRSLRAPCTEHWCSGVVAGLAALNASGARPSLLVYSQPSAPHSRRALQFYLSDDGGGQEWRSGPVLWPELAGYSDITAVGSDSVGILFECGTATFSDRISFAVVGRSFLTGT